MGTLIGSRQRGGVSYCLLGAIGVACVHQALSDCNLPVGSLVSHLHHAHEAGTVLRNVEEILQHLKYS